jgi:diguanylate cyclase (GGDEF)-like protein/PAS domain S-box-containing protein
MITRLLNQFSLNTNRIFSRFRLYRFLPVFVLVLPLLVTYQLWMNVKREAEQSLQAEFDFHALDIVYRIEQRMETNEKILRGAQGLYAATGNVSRAAFRQYVNQLDLINVSQGIQGLGFTLWIPKEKKEQHIAAVRSEGYAAYSIKPAGERDGYSSVVFIEPFAGRNMNAFGYDNFADPVRRLAMERARDTGMSAISGKIKLVQESDEHVQAGLLMWLPVYRHEKPHGTVSERRANFTGWVGASYRMDDLMNGIFKEDSRVNIQIYDGEEISPRTLMHDGQKTSGSGQSYDPYFKSVKLLNIAGHKWSVVISSLPEFDKRLSNTNHQHILLAGITISVLLALITLVLVLGRERAVEFAQALHHEMAERKGAEAGMRLAAMVFDTVDTGVLMTDRGTRIIKVNPAFTAITGYTPEEAIGKTPRLLASGSHTREFYKNMWSAITTKGSWQGEIFNRRKNGEFFTEWLSINEVRDEDGKLTNYVALFSDISERKAAEEHMTTLAHYDPLTGLPNRTLLTDRMQQAIAAAKREKSHMALMFIDLDKFKPVNDTLGHQIGDLMLKEVARRMLECLRESDSAARIGGDEFVVLLPVIEAEADAVAVAEKIRDALNQPFMLAGHSLFISSSIGVAEYPEHGNDEKTLLRNADTAMYFAKEAGRNNVMLFDHAMKRLSE